MEHWPVQVQEHGYCRKRKRLSRSQDKPEGYWKEVLNAPLSCQPSPDPPKARCSTPPLPRVSSDPRVTSDLPVPAPCPEPEPRSTAAECPVFLGLVPRPQPPAEVQTPQSSGTGDEPLVIHGYTVEQYQSIYHSVVDDMLTFKSGRPRPYSLELGRRIKQRLWEALNRPCLTVGETSSGLLRVQESSSDQTCPPHIDVDISGEPAPKRPRLH